jgi:non-specific serine/threonine protein kinase
MTEDTASEYRFGRFVVQPRERRLLVDGEPVTAGPRAFDVLLALLERAGALVAKPELLERVWPGLVVEENNLQVQVSTLRKLLGPGTIATIPGHGYRFTARIEVVAKPPSTRARVHNLPQPLTSFVGHEGDLAEYAQLLEQTRLLTLTGVGGCGKTRLAIELARMILPAFPDGVWFVDLAPVADAERVATAVATALGVREEGDRPIGETLARHLEAKHLLLVLDNCEHVLHASADLVQRCLTAAPRVRALATSREGLGIAGERVAPVRSLAMPPAQSARDPATIATFESVRLFVDRARQVARDFELNPSNAPALAEICRRLDGIPLALELAAARARMLSLEQIRERLDDRFRLLTGNSRSIARHQTLLHTLQWSYGQLAQEEQLLLRQLSVFAGGWTLRDAGSVAGSGPDELAILDGLERLVDKSLVLVRRDAYDEPRYHMLETVRQFAQDRLNEAGEAQAARNRHLECFVALAQEAEAKLGGEQQGEWLARFGLERENFMAAHAWCDHAPEMAERGLILVAALNDFFLHSGLIALGYRLTAEALNRPGAREESLARCRALWAAGALGYFMGRYDEARGHVEPSLALARGIGDKARAAEALRLLGYVKVALCDRAAAREHLQDALALSRETADKARISKALSALAELHRAEGRLDEAEGLYGEALALDRARADFASVAVSLVNLAAISINRGRVDRAVAMVREGIAIAEDIGSKRVGVVQVQCAVGLASVLGEWERAARLHGAVEALSEQMGYYREPAERAYLGPLIARTRDALGEAGFAAAEACGRSLSYEEAISQARELVEKRAGSAVA